MTGYLRAQTQTLYVIPEHKAGFVKRLMQTHRLRPQADGSIEILDAFWAPSLLSEAGVAPPVLVYADLMASLSSRNLETAAKLRAGALQHALDQSERPLDPMAVEILRVVQHVIAARGLSCIVVGATARDILLTHVHGLPATRATRDIDFRVGRRRLGVVR